MVPRPMAEFFCQRIMTAYIDSPLCNQWLFFAVGLGAFSRCCGV